MIQYIQSEEDRERIKGAVVSGKLEGQTEECYIPFSKGSGDSPVIATEQFAVPKKGYDLTDTLRLNNVSDKCKVQISMANININNKTAPMDLGVASQYLLIGGREYNKGSYRGIGFGYVGNPTEVAPVFVGMQEQLEDSNTLGDFVVAVRNTTVNEAPTVRLRIDSTGQITASEGYAPKAELDLATKKYVDDAVKGGGGSGGSTFAKNVSCPAMPPSGTSINVEDILRDFNRRIANCERQLPNAE